MPEAGGPVLSGASAAGRARAVDGPAGPRGAEAAKLGLPALAEMVASVGDGITVCDAERRFVYANPAACRMLGLPLEQLRGRDFLDVLPAWEREFALPASPKGVAARWEIPRSRSPAS